MPKLGVNIDHIATLRQQREGCLLNLLEAAKVCEANGSDSIVVHLREDRRHIQDNDVVLLRSAVKTRLNLEMAVVPEIISIALRVKPDQATLVPEKRQELTTEGGLDVVKFKSRISRAVATLQKKGIDCSLFIEPDKKQIEAAYAAGARIIELHTGSYANCRNLKDARREFKRIRDAVDLGCDLGMVVNAGHGLDYKNAGSVAKLDGIYELNIGYSIVCRAVFAGLGKAVREMKDLIR